MAEDKRPLADIVAEHLAKKRLEKAEAEIPSYPDYEYDGDDEEESHTEYSVAVQVREFDVWPDGEREWVEDYDEDDDTAVCRFSSLAEAKAFAVELRGIHGQGCLDVPKPEKK